MLREGECVLCVQRPACFLTFFLVGPRPISVQATLLHSRRHQQECGSEERAMALPRGRGHQRAVAEASSLASTSYKKPQKSRLYRIANEALPSTSIFSGAIHIGTCQYFNLLQRRLPQDALDSINKGPPCLAGSYPPGLLHARHEKYRLINHVKIDTWRSGEESEEDHQQAEESLRQLSMQRLPILDGQSEKIPTTIITSKKRVHKLSVVRHQVAKKLWNAFDRAVKRLQGSANEVGKGG